MVDRSDSASAANNRGGGFGLTGTKQLVRGSCFDFAHQGRVVGSSRKGDFTDDCAAERSKISGYYLGLAFIKGGVFIARVEQGETAPTQLFIEETRGALGRGAHQC